MDLARTTRQPDRCVQKPNRLDPARDRLGAPYARSNISHSASKWGKSELQCVEQFENFGTLDENVDDLQSEQFADGVEEFRG
jgi:hypothetical protein